MTELITQQYNQLSQDHGGYFPLYKAVEIFTNTHGEQATVDWLRDFIDDNFLQSYHANFEE